MNQALRNNPAPSAGEMAKNLENFELQIAQQTIADLQAQLKAQELAHVDEISAIRKHEGVVTDPIAAAIEALQSIPAKDSLIACQQGVITETSELLDAAEEAKTILAEKLEEALAACKQSDSNYRKAQENSENALQQLQNTNILLKSARADLKDLKALNPKKLQTQNKNLQKKNSELHDANGLMKKQLNGLRKQHEKLEQDHLNLQRQKDAIDASFTKLQEDINSGTATDVVLDSGEWQICTHATLHDALYIVDKKTDIVRPYFNGEIPKARAIPQAIKDAALIQCEKNKRAAASLGYQQH